MVAAVLASLAAAAAPTNFVVILCDDMGYGDLSCYGNNVYETPNIDRLAREGVRFTDFYSTPACSPTRASLMTGCYPARVGINEVLNPTAKIGLNPREDTIAKLLNEKGYATACVGKWHLGLGPSWPTKMGFDQFYGLPYSHDMWPPNGKNWPPLYLYEGTRRVKEIKTLEDQGELTGRYTRYALDFIEKNKGRPFFLYLAQSMPHVPVYPGRRFLGKSGKGLYADVVQEIDWSVGEVVAQLKRLKLERNTLVVFTSDNGPWIPYGDHAGSTAGLREGKGTNFEGGTRVPAVFWQPGTVPAGVVRHQIAAQMDLLPTIVARAGAPRPSKKIDGHDISSLLTASTDVRSPWECLYYYYPGKLDAVRSGRWKLHVPHPYLHLVQAGTGGLRGKQTTLQTGWALYDMVADPLETTDVSGLHPDVVGRLKRYVEDARQELGDTLTKRSGSGVRAPATVTPLDFPD